MLVDLLLLLVLMAVCSFAPGFFFVRRLPWTPLEKLCGSVGLSLVLLYLASWGIFCFGPQDQRMAYWLVAVIAIGLGAAAWKDALRLFRTFRVRAALLWFGILLAWTLLMLAIIRVYSGAGWGGDWFEHLQRTLFFLNRLPLHSPIFPNYSLPARPPLVNVIAAFFLGLTDDRFELCQVAFAFLNLLMFLPSLLIVPVLGVTRKRAVVPLAVLFAASPVVMESLTYTWTKAFAALYVILAIALYLAGLRKNDGRRIFAAFVALAAGFLGHYSVGPYLVFLTIHYLVVRVARQRLWREALAIGAVCGLLLATWFVWSAAVYGWKETVSSNTAVSQAQEYKGSTVEKIAANLIDTIVPVWMREGIPKFPPAEGFPATRDSAFIFYQVGLPFAMGVVGGPLAIGLLVLALWRKGSAREPWFWTWMIPACTLLGIAVVGERDANGLAHLTLLPLVVLGICFVAARFFDLRRAARFVLIAGCVVDCYFGVFLQARVEALENAPGKVYFVEDINTPPPDASQLAAKLGGALSLNAWYNWQFKHRYQMAEEQLVTIPQRYGNRQAFPTLWPRIKAALDGTLNDDANYWGGWAKRHGGVVKHLGDWTAEATGVGNTVPLAALGLFFVGLMAMLAKLALQVKAAPVVATPPAKPRSAVARKHR